MQSSPNHHALLSLIYAFHSCLNKVFLNKVIFTRYTVFFIYWLNVWMTGPSLSRSEKHILDGKDKLNFVRTGPGIWGYILSVRWKMFSFTLNLSIWLCSIIMTIPIILATRLRKVFIKLLFLTAWILLFQLKWWKHQKNWKPTSSLGVCELIFDFKKIFSYTNCTELNIEFLKSINEESKRTEDDLDKIMSSGMLLVNNILNGSAPTTNQPRISPTDERIGIFNTIWLEPYIFAKKYLKNIMVYF